MLFTSFEFLIFFSIFFTIYWLVFSKNLKWQNRLLLISSYFFYGWLDWRFSVLLAFSSLFNFVIGFYVSTAKNEKNRKLLVLASVLQGIGTLVVFKYYNFFIDSFADFASKLGITLGFTTLNLLLPIGISFYTFRILSYVLDINNEKLKPVSNWIVFFNYVSFFPCLLAGPIDRAHHLIPQFEKSRTFSYASAVDGMRQILWGLFKKIIIANNCALFVDKVFENYNDYPASSLFLASFLYFIQIYADFSGYSDIAIGVARLLGFDVKKNFNFPFFSESIPEFWRKWHISLTSWMTDFVYTPLSFHFRKHKKKGVVFAIMINFILVGLWHGANWTYVIFGFLQSLYFIPFIIFGDFSREKREISHAKKLIKILLVFFIMMMSTVLLRIESISAAVSFYGNMLSLSVFSKPKIGMQTLIILIFFISLLLIVEWFNKNKEHGLELTFIKSRSIRWLIYLMIITSIGLFGGLTQEKFIYFNF